MPTASISAYRLFPLVRHISARLSPVLGRSPFSANQVSYLSLVLGLGAAWCMLYESYWINVIGGVLMVLCYILDNCDGEVARIKGQCSEYGRRLDNFIDWAVHTALFAALGIGVAESSGQDIWAWMGWAAALGSSINYIIGTVAEEQRAKAGITSEDIPVPEEHDSPPPENIGQWLMYAFRELSRADFCFILLGLSLFGVAWVLLPLGAVGAQVFWVVHLLPGARERHV